MQLSTEEYVKFALIKGSPLEVNITPEGEITLQDQEIPEEYEPHIIKDLMTHIFIQVAEEGRAYVQYTRNNFHIYKRPKLLLIFQEITFKGYNKKGTPVLLIDNQEVSGYREISFELFGYYREDIAKVVSPYLIREFNKGELIFVEYKTYMGRPYPVFRYGNSKKLIKGLAHLKKMFPQLTDKELKDLEPQSMDKPLLRHSELIQRFKIEHVNGIYYLNDPDDNTSDVELDSQRKVMAFIRGKGESISRETAKRLFESL